MPLMFPNRELTTNFDTLQRKNELKEVVENLNAIYRRLVESEANQLDFKKEALLLKESFNLLLKRKNQISDIDIKTIRQEINKMLFAMKSPLISDDYKPELKIESKEVVKSDILQLTDQDFFNELEIKFNDIPAIKNEISYVKNSREEFLEKISTLREKLSEISASNEKLQELDELLDKKLTIELRKTFSP